MGTVLEYLEKYGKYTFGQMPMTEVDSLVLCQLSYLKFDGMVPGLKEEGEGVTLCSLPACPDYENLFADVRFEKHNRELLERMASGARFRNMKLNFYENTVDEENESQFSAVTYLLEEGMPYVAFRGTDETIVGWKEDFNMAFLKPVPGQKYSVRYLEEAAGRFSGDFFVGGHSKGGNLAMYSAMNCTGEVQNRILKIYSMDGPGFRPEVLEASKYDRISERVVKILPTSSLVGMLFESDMHFQVVRSKAIGLLQHDPYTWQVASNHLVRANHMYERRRKMDNTLNEWILSLDEEQLHTFVDTLYQVITASQADNLIDFTAEWKKSMNGVVAALKEVDQETREMLAKMVKSLFEVAKTNRRRQFHAAVDQLTRKPEKKDKPKPAVH